MSDRETKRVRKGEREETWSLCESPLSLSLSLLCLRRSRCHWVVSGGSALHVVLLCWTRRVGFFCCCFFSLPFRLNFYTIRKSVRVFVCMGTCDNAERFGRLFIANMLSSVSTWLTAWFGRATSGHEATRTELKLHFSGKHNTKVSISYCKLAEMYCANILLYSF